MTSFGLCLWSSVQESANIRQFMATFDPASMVFGSFAGQIDAAFGSSMGWIVGNLLLLVVVFGLIQAIRNSFQIIEHFEITNSKITSWIGYTIATIIQHMIFFSFGFPFIGAFLTAISSTLLWKWTFDTLTPTDA